MKKTILVLIAIIVLVVVAIAISRVFKKSEVDAYRLKPEHELTVDKLIDAFDLDEASANSVFLDKVMLVEGEVVELDTSNPESPFLVLGSGHSLTGVMCNFHPNHLEKLSSIQKGSIIKVKGICTGLLMDIVLVKCVIVE
jgi:hypothetical protein